MSDNETTVTLKHVNDSGAVVWEKSFVTEDPTEEEAFMSNDGDRVLVQWPDGIALFYMRPGERIEITGTEATS